MGGNEDRTARLWAGIGFLEGGDRREGVGKMAHISSDGIVFVSSLSAPKLNV